MIGGRMMQVGMGLLVAFGIAIVVLALAVSLAEAAETASPATAVSLGTVLAPWLEVIVLVLGSPVAAGLVALLVRAAGALGFSVEEGRRARLQEIIGRGLALGAQELGVRLDGQLSVDVRNELVARGVAYTAAYGHDTLRRLRQSPADITSLEELIGARLAERQATGPPAAGKSSQRKRTRKAASTTRPAP